jgi:hypothetical protein
MEGAAARRADAPPTESRGQNLNVYVEEDGADGASAVGECGIKRRHLRCVSWESIKDHPIRGVGLREPATDHAEGDFVGDELPCIYI